MATQFADGVETPFSDALRSHNEHIAELNKADPSLQLKSMQDVFGDVKTASKEAEHRANLSTTFGGTIGGFVGAAVAGIDPRTDPLNFLTLPIGGAGKTIATRMATQAGAQGFAETINQATGVQENRRLLGLDSGVGRAALSIGGAVIGGAAVQGVGEAIGAGFRRATTGKWFADTPRDPAPPMPAERVAPEPVAGTDIPQRPVQNFDAAFERAFPEFHRSPLMQSRMGEPRAAQDFDHIDTALREWGGARPWEIPPPTETRLPGEPPRSDYALTVSRGMDDIDTIARRLDPDVFNAYDKMAAARQTLRAQIDDPAAAQLSTDQARAASEVRAQIAETRQQLENATGRVQKNLERKLADLEKSFTDNFRNVDTEPPLAGHVRNLRDLDEQIHELAPSISRAYGRAQNKWDAYAEQKARLDEMLGSGAPGIRDIPKRAGTTEIPEWSPDIERGVRAVPELQAPGVVKPDEPLATAVMRVNKEIQKQADEFADTFKSDLIRQATPKEGETPDNILRMNVRGKELELHLDETITVPGDDGSTRVISVRQLAKEMEDDNNMLKAVSSCSIGGI
jgi:hypothetical protein